MDLTLIRRCQSGDQDAFTLLFEQHKNLVFRTAVLTLGDSHDAEDLLQEVFLQVHRHLGSYNPNLAAFTTWLYRITVNKCLNWRRDHPQSESLDDVDELALSNTDDMQDQQAENEFIQQALGRLTRKLRVVVILRHYWELPYAEISDILDLPLGTVKSRINSAMRKLQKDLRDNSSPHVLSLKEVKR